MHISKLQIPYIGKKRFSVYYIAKKRMVQLVPSQTRLFKFKIQEPLAATKWVHHPRGEEALKRDDTPSSKWKVEAGTGWHISRAVQRAAHSWKRNYRVRNTAIYNFKNKWLKIKQEYHHMEHITTPIIKLLHIYSNGTFTSITSFINLDMEIMLNH